MIRLATVRERMMFALLVSAAFHFSEPPVIEHPDADYLAVELSRFNDGVLLERDTILAREHLQWLRNRACADLDICPWLPDLIKEQQDVAAAYNWLDIALRGPEVCDCGLIDVNAEQPLRDPENYEERMEALRRLRVLLGEEAYLCGQMPPP